MPSLPPLFGSLMFQVKNANMTPGKPTIMNAACHAFKPKGALIEIGYADDHSSTIHPPKNKPIPAPR